MAQSGGVIPEPMRLFREAVALHQDGRFDEAERLYRAVLARVPGHPGPLHFLGVIEAQRGRHAEAVALMDKSLAADPRNPAVHYNRANALWALKRREEALAGFERTLSVKPDHSAALNNRAALLHEMGRHQEALSSFDSALERDPNNADAHANRAHLLNEMKRPEEALAACARALQLAPANAAAENNRGNALRDLRRPAEALDAYDRSLGLRPDNAGVWTNRGNALKDLRRFGEALASYDRALALAPRQLDTLSNRGFALLETSDWTAAEKSFADALAIAPDHAHALYGRGQALLELKRHDEAIKTYERLVAVEPEYPYGLGMLLHAKRTACDWRGLSEVSSQVLSAIRSGKRAATPYAFLYGSDSPADNLLCAQILVRQTHAPSPAPLWRGERYQHDRIRVAYLSADFRAHAVATLIAGVLEAHDKSAFETIAISVGPDDGSAMRARLSACFDRFIDARALTNEDAAKRIRALECDIAVDLTGYTAEGRGEMLAFRPAPVQANYLGYPGTMGAEYYDYILADANVIPEEDKRYYSEQVVALPHCYMPIDPARGIGTPPSRREAGLPEEAFVFASFNNPYKITPEMFDIWMRLLAQAENSVLWLSRANQTAMRNLRSEAAARGIAPERVIFAPFLKSAEEHLGRLPLADLFLDTTPCNAHTTANDALLAGLPLLTLRGHSFAGRVAASLLTAAGLTELIADSRESYEAMALRFARAPQALAAIRATLAQRKQTAPLFDPKRFCRSLEAAYRIMWERYRRLEAPASFTVAP